MGKALKNYADWRVRENLRDYDFYFRSYRRKIMNMFKWENLPDGISQRFIERELFYSGFCLFFKSKMGFFVASRGSFTGLNQYDEPTGYNAIMTSSDSRINNNEFLTPNECVCIWNNFDIEGNAQDVHHYAKRLSNIDKTIEMNLEQLKNPVMISCPEGQRTTVEEILKRKTDGVPYIVTVDDITNLTKISVLDMHVKDNLESLNNAKTIVNNEGLTNFGINNVNIQKKERLIEAEGDQNDEQINLNKIAMLQTRLKACEEINKMFGLNVSVKFNTLDKEHNYDLDIQSLEGDV